LSLAFQSTPNFTNIVEYSTTLATNSWLVLTNVPPAGTAQNAVINDAVTTPRRYYRVRLGN
jgi:hypothetical protein